VYAATLVDEVHFVASKVIHVDSACELWNLVGFRFEVTPVEHIFPDIN